MDELAMTTRSGTDVTRVTQQEARANSEQCAADHLEQCIVHAGFGATKDSRPHAKAVDLFHRAAFCFDTCSRLAR